MEETNKEDRVSVYEISFLIAGVPEDRVSAEADAIRSAITAAGGTIIGEEAPVREPLAYTIRKKNVAGSYEKYDEAHFGWIKFEAVSTKVEALKKGIEAMPSILRTLLITTVRENTYLGKRVPAVVTASVRRPFAGLEAAPAAEGESAAKDPAAAAAVPASPEELDKSIDEMVKEA